MHNMPELMCRLMKARSVTFNLRYITAGKHDNEPIFFLFNDTPVCSQNSQKYLIYITSEVLWWNRQWELRHYWMFKLMVCWNWWWKIVHVHNPLLNMNSFCGSILLVCSASGYFSSTSITFYISSKHGILVSFMPPVPCPSKSTTFVLTQLHHLWCPPILLVAI